MCQGHRSRSDPGRNEQRWKVQLQHLQEVCDSPSELDDDRSWCVPPGTHGVQYSPHYASKF